MKALIVGLHAETFLHPGSGQNDGAIDLPIARERSTDLPVIYGSMLKGALNARLHHAKNHNANAAEDTAKDAEKDATKKGIEEDKERFFGKQESAGGILVGDARLLLLPVRSSAASFKWVTSPKLIQRLARDLARAGDTLNVSIPAIDSATYLSNTAATETETTDKQPLFLEEWLFTKATKASQEATDWQTLITAISQLMPDLVKASLEDNLLIVNDDDFALLARQGMPVQARNQLNPDTKSSENLWYEETISPDTLFYSLFLPRFDAELLKEFAQSQVSDNAYLQIGGNETVGQGWVHMTAYVLSEQTQANTEAA